MNAPNPEASVVIRTFNEERWLPNLLQALQKQTYQNFEVIVVDSGSFDQTVELARKGGAQVIEINSQDFTFGYSLNTGIAAAKGQFLVLVSAHTWPVDNMWMGHLLTHLKEDNVAMVYGRQFGTSNSKFSELQDFQRTFGSERRRLKDPDFFANNANSAVRRELWQQQPFDERLPGLEDIHWAKHWMLKGHEVVYVPEAGIFHIHHETWSQVRHRYFREAVAAMTIGIKGRADLWKVPLQELRWLLHDFLLAAQGGELFRRAGEIWQYRFQKSIGTVKGLLRGKPITEQSDREAIFFDRKPMALVIRGPNKAVLEEVPFPKIKPSEVLIEVAYEGVCGTDLGILRRTLGYYKSGVANYPIIPGHEFSGWISQRGAKVEGLHRGDPVVVEVIQGCGSCDVCAMDNPIACKDRKELGVIGLNGGYCQYVATSARFVHKLPSDMDMKLAALCEPTAVALKGLKRIDGIPKSNKADPRYAVVGTGPIGHICAQILAHRALDVTVFDRNPTRLEPFQGSAIHIGGNELSLLDQFEVIIEATGDPDVLATMFAHSKPGVIYLLLGLPYARQEVSFESLVAYDVAILGSVGSSASEFAEAIELLPMLPLQALTEHVVPFEECREILSRFKDGVHVKTLLKLSA